MLKYLGEPIYSSFIFCLNPPKSVGRLATHHPCIIVHEASKLRDRASSRWTDVSQSLGGFLAYHAVTIGEGHDESADGTPAPGTDLAQRMSTSDAHLIVVVLERVDQRTNDALFLGRNFSER